MFGNYRVWCKNRKEWERDEVLLSPNGNLFQIMRGLPIPISRETHIVEFCTELKDKNGVYIYEGDTVYDDNAEYYVEWNDEVGKFIARMDAYGGEELDDLFIYYIPLSKNTSKELEVVGNIHTGLYKKEPESEMVLI